MKKEIRALNPEALRSQFVYEPETGKLTRLTTGKSDWSKSTGYLQVMLDGRPCHAHRIAWVIYHGKNPARQIDHINGDRSDNRICNLREADETGNMRNKGKHKNNTSGFPGVCWHKQQGKWRAFIMLHYRQFALGLFETKEEAIVARIEAEKRHFGAFRRIHTQEIAA